MSLFQKSGALFDRILSVLAFIAAAIILFIMLSVGADVVMRYCFKQPQIWVLEITEYALLFMTFLATAWLLKNEGHVKMDLILLMLKPKTRSVVNSFTTVLLAILFLFVTWYGVKVCWEHFQGHYITSTPLAVPSGPLVAVIPAGSFLLFVQSLRMLCTHLKSLKQNMGAKE